MSAVAAEPVTTPAVRRGQTLRRACRGGRMRLGLGLTAVVVVLAIFGPLFAPYGEAALVGPPYAGPSADFPLGTDVLGHDVLSRVLYGGRTVLWMSLAATVLGVTVGTVLGLIAGYWRGWVDSVTMTVLDMILAFPQFVLPILFVSLIGPKLWMVVGLVALVHAPRIARLARASTLDVASREYIEACELIGVPRRRIIFGEVLPNISTPILVEAGIRMTWSIGIIAAISFLGFGIQPPNADWGLMINENRTGISIQSWAVAAPAICIGLFAVGTNLIAEGYTRAVAGVSTRKNRERR